MDFEHLIYNVDNLVATITLNRPETLNALTPSMRKSFAAALELAENDDSVRVIVITGAGKGFCFRIKIYQSNYFRRVCFQLPQIL